MHAERFSRLSTETGIAAVIRSAEIRDEEVRAVERGEEPVLGAKLLKRIAELQVIVPAVQEYGSLTEALQRDEILRDRLVEHEQQRRFAILLKKGLRQSGKSD